MKNGQGPGSRTGLKISREVVLVAAACVVVTGAAVRFWDNIHYNHLLLQANSRADTAQIQLSQEKQDIRFMIKNDNHQLNCYDLQSSYDRGLCRTHDQTNPNP